MILAPRPLAKAWQIPLVVLWLHLAALRVRAEEDAASLKFQSYQEADGRIRVDSWYGSADASLPAEIRLKLTGVVDTIAGATPTGELRKDLPDPVVLADMHDRRKAWHAEVSRVFAPTQVALGYDNSRESDYVSNGFSLNTATDFNAKNTTLLAGLAYADDEVKDFGANRWRGKHAIDGILGVTQLIDPATTLRVSLSLGRSSGFLDDPYKLVSRSIEVLPGLFQHLTFAERRPDLRTKWIASTTVNHAFKDLHGAAELSYRWYDDTFGVHGHTVALQWFQRLAGERLLAIPSVRYYRQSAADFYHPDLDATSIIPETVPGQHYSSDYRLAKLETLNLGFKLVWFVVPDRFSVDAAIDHYRMRGRDGATSSSAFPSANSYTFGGRFTW